MTNPYTHQTQNILKTWFIMTVFFAVVICVGWFASLYFGNQSILYIAVVFSIGMNITSYWFSDKIVLSMTGAREATRAEFFNFYTIVENLSITAGLPMPKLYVIDDQAPNAFATGRNKEHSVVAVTTGLLQILDKNELEGVIAHELSHIGNRDMLVSTVAVVLVGFVTIISDMAMRASFFGGNNDRDNKASGVILAIGIVLMILAPIAATLLQLAVSRKREFLADASGVLLTRYPEGLANALKKIGGYNRPMVKANNATAHLFISNPFGANNNSDNKTPFLVKIFSTHPPINERVNALVG